jgi:peptide/nickel transport system substrate-binding protein
MNVRVAQHRPRAAVGVVVITAVLALLSTLFVGVAVAATPKAAPKAAAPKPGGEVTYGLEAETAGGYCLPSARLAISGIEVASAVYDTLVVPNTKNVMVPYLAKSVAHDAAYTTWTVVLKDGITFHDGSPLNADVVVANFQAIQKAPLLGAAFVNLASVTATNPTTVTFVTKTPWVHFDGFLFLDGRAGIIALAQLNSPDCATKMIGTGPFKLDHWTVDQELVVTKNPNYWQKDAKGTQLPYLDKITFKPVLEAAQRVNGLKGGQLTMIHTTNGQQIQQLTGTLAGQFNLLQEKPGRREVRYYLMNASKAPLDDPNARLAVAMAIDRNQINEISNAGVNQLADGPFDKDVLGYMKNPGFPKFNLKKATALASAYKASHGGQFSVVLEHTNDPANAEEAQIIKQQLAKAGIDSTLKSEDQTAFIVSAVTQNFSIMLWRNHPGDDPDGQYQWWTNTLLNFGKFNDPTMQALLDQGRSETDEAKRAQIYQQVNQEFSKQVFNVWGYYIQWVIAAQKNVQGLAGPPLPDKGGNPLFLYGREPLLGLYLTK